MWVFFFLFVFLMYLMYFYVFSFLFFFLLTEKGWVTEEAGVPGTVPNSVTLNLCHIYHL